MWPSGKSPFGKRDRRTNSGSVSNSSLDKTNLVPLYVVSSCGWHRRSSDDYRPYLRSMVIVSSAPTSAAGAVSGENKRPVGCVMLTSEGIGRRPTLLNLSNNTRGSARGRHYVGE